MRSFPNAQICRVCITPEPSAFDGRRERSSPRWRGATPTTFPSSARRSAMPMHSTASSRRLRPAEPRARRQGRRLLAAATCEGADQPPVHGLPVRPRHRQCRRRWSGGNLLTALRTAAAAAVSVKHLARTDAKVLGMVGAGHQSTFQLRAVARTAGIREGHRLEPPSRDVAEARRGGRRSSACPSRRCDLDRLAPRPTSSSPSPRRFAPILHGRAGQARNAPGLHGHRHQGQAGGRGGASGARARSSPTRSRSRSPSARPARRRAA